MFTALSDPGLMADKRYITTLNLHLSCFQSNVTQETAELSCEHGDEMQLAHLANGALSSEGGSNL